MKEAEGGIWDVDDVKGCREHVIGKSTGKRLVLRSLQLHPLLPPLGGSHHVIWQRGILLHLLQCPFTILII